MVLRLPNCFEPKKNDSIAVHVIKVQQLDTEMLSNTTQYGNLHVGKTQVRETLTILPLDLFQRT